MTLPCAIGESYGSRGEGGFLYHHDTLGTTYTKVDTPLFLEIIQVALNPR